MRGNRGQVSLEFIIVTAVFLFIALAMYPFITRDAELSKGVSAARDGATYGVATYNMKGTISQVPYKLRTVDYSISGSTVTFTCTINGTSSTALNTEVKRQMMRFVHKSITGGWPTTDPSSVSGGHYTYQAGDCTFG